MAIIAPARIAARDAARLAAMADRTSEATGGRSPPGNAIADNTRRIVARVTAIRVKRVLRVSLGMGRTERIVAKARVVLANSAIKVSRDTGSTRRSLAATIGPTAGRAKDCHVVRADVVVVTAAGDRRVIAPVRAESTERQRSCLRAAPLRAARDQ